MTPSTILFNLKKISFLKLLFLLILCYSNPLNAQVAFSGWDGTTGDEFTFVLLRDYAAGEVIYFTEEDYSSAADAFGTGEGHLAYTIPAGGLLENEVIRITESSANTYSVNCAGGTAVHVAGTGNWSFSTADEIYAYTASNAASPWNTITEILSFVWSQVIAIVPDQDPSINYPNVIIIDFNIGGGGGTNADFMNASRTNTTLAMLQDGSNWNQSTGDLALVCTDFTNQLLPIELLYFSGKPNDEIAILEWATSSEINNDYFTIEHSINGIDFYSLDKVTGNGNTSETMYYSYIHETPYSGLNYYRLSQTDFDGTNSFGQTITVSINSTKYEVNIAPNPFNSFVDLDLTGFENNTKLTIEMVNLLGLKVMEKEILINDSNQRFSMNTSNIVKGSYILNVKNKMGIIRSIRLIKF